MKKIHLIAAARPNFMKIAPLYHVLKDKEWCQVRLIHTGQHYDANMSDDIFTDLQLPKPDYHLGIGGGTHAQQVGQVMIAYENICLEEERPDLLIVVGDVNATAACAQVAAKLHIKCAHLEAGLRSGDRGMPEEINRLITDAICDYMWTPSPDGDEHLLAEGHNVDKIARVGNIMLDSFEMMRSKINAANKPDEFNLEPGHYGVVTLHRPSNVDFEDTLKLFIHQIKQVATEDFKLIYAVHPRTKNNLQKFGLWDELQAIPHLILTEPLSYIPFMSLIQSAKMVITDSGGLQEETTYLGIPCITLRENTERPVTVTEGTNKLVKMQDLLAHVEQVHAGDWPTGRKPEFWDGKTADRALAQIEKILGVD